MSRVWPDADSDERRLGGSCGSPKFLLRNLETDIELHDGPSDSEIALGLDVFGNSKSQATAGNYVIVCILAAD